MSGFKSKRQMAQDRFNVDSDMTIITSTVTILLIILVVALIL